MTIRWGRLACVVAALVLIFAAFSGTAWAFLGDGEQPITEGSINLQLNRETRGAGRLNVSGALPGDSGNMIYRLDNTGKVAGDLSIGIPSITNIAGADGEFADGRGDLGANLEVAFFLDLDGNAEWSAGDVGLRFDGTVSPGGALNANPFDSYNGARWTDTVRLAPRSRVDLLLCWHIPESAGNEIQGDSVTFDIQFMLAQAK